MSTEAALRAELAALAARLAAAEEELAALRDLEGGGPIDKLSRAVLEQVAEAVVVCDAAGRIVRASEHAYRLSGESLLLEPFDKMFPLTFAAGRFPDVASFLAQPLSGRRLRGVDATLAASGAEPGGHGDRFDRCELMLSAGPMWDGEKRIVGSVITLTDVTGRKRAEDELRQAKLAAEEANRAKDRFLATLSHELRTPLTPVLAVVSALERDGRLREGVRDSLAMVRRNVELEARLIDDLLDLTRIEHGRLELQLADCDLAQILDHALQTCAEELVARRINLIEDIAVDGGRLAADAPRLTQVFWNLLKNAIKFTPEGGTITLRARRVPANGGGDSIAVEVADTGVGIEPEDLAHVFDAFEQGRADSARRMGGLGLGLAISKTLVERHGGRVTAASEGRGKGAAFTVELPLQPGTAAPEDGDGKTAGRGSDGDGRQPAPAGPLRILLIEDHPDTADALADLLEMMGHRVTVAGSIAQALDEAARADGALDLVVSDLGLPDGSGHDLMRELAGRYGLRGIALSGYGMEEDIRQSHEAGFGRHLTKPVTLAALELAIAEAAARRG
jgi:two-component system CheB/CheR fusion protein